MNFPLKKPIIMQDRKDKDNYGVTTIDGMLITECGPIEDAKELLKERLSEFKKEQQSRKKRHGKN